MRKNKIFGVLLVLILISFLFVTNVKAENGKEYQYILKLEKDILLQEILN